MGAIRSAALVPRITVRTWAFISGFANSARQQTPKLVNTGRNWSGMLTEDGE